MIRITCSQEGYIRCREVHPEGTTEYPDDRFNDQQIKVMRQDPKLKVEIIEGKSSKKESKNKKN